MINYSDGFLISYCNLGLHIWAYVVEVHKLDLPVVIVFVLLAEEQPSPFVGNNCYTVDQEVL